MKRGSRTNIFMSQKKEFLIRKVQSGLVASRKLFGVTSFPGASRCISMWIRTLARTRIRTVGRKKKFRDAASVDDSGRRWTKVDRITGTCCAGSGAVSSSRLTGKRRFRRRYKTHGASARFLRPGSAAFYSGSTFPERRQNRAQVRSDLKPQPSRYRNLSQ